MNNSKQIVSGFLRRAHVWVVMTRVLKGGMKSVYSLVGGFLGLMALDLVFGLSLIGLKIGWCVIVGFSFGVFIFTFFPLHHFSISSQSKKLIPHLREDDLLIAAQFLKNKPNGLESVFIDQIALKLERLSARLCSPRENWRSLLLSLFFVLSLAGAVFAFAPSTWRPDARIFFPFKNTDLSQIVLIEPGNASVPRGADAEVHLRLLLKTIEKPRLLLKVGNVWQEISPSDESGPIQTYVLKTVVEPVVYRVAWKKDFSRKYMITPKPPVQLTEFKIHITPPPYISGEPLEQTSPEITALAGSNIRLDVWSTEPLTDQPLKWDDGTMLFPSEIDGLRRRFIFQIEKETTYSLGTQDHYPIHMRWDGAPHVTLLSPSEDLVVGEKEKIPLTYDVRDDFGLGRVQINWEINGKVKDPILIEQFGERKLSSLSTHLWDLNRLKTRSGDLVRYQLETWDNNTVTGPGKAVTPWRVIELAGFEEAHADIEAALEDWRKKAVDLLAKVSRAQNRLEKDNPDWADATSAFDEAASQSQRLDEYLKKIVSKMEDDPLADYGVWLEHRMMSENMEAMNETIVKQAQSAFQTQNKTAASTQMNAMSSELERMLALSDDLSKAQRARDLLEANERLEELAEDLVNDLISGTMSSELKKKIDEVLQEAMKNLADMARALQEMPETLPEDFVNQEALKDLNLGQTKDILSQISEAIKSGDAQKALSLAQSLLTATQQMQKSLSRAHDSFLETRSASELEKKLEEQKQALDEVIKNQTNILSDTQKIESKRWASVLQEQKKLLDDLFERQTKAVAVAKTESRLGGQIPSMEIVLKELELKQIEQTPELLKTILVQIDLIGSDMARSSAPAAAVQVLQRVQSDEKYIFDQLIKPTHKPITPSKEDSEEMKHLEKRQSELQTKTQNIKKELQGLSQKTATLKTSLMQSLGSAGQEMRDASKNLGDGDSRSAQSHEERALSHLLEGSAQLSQAQSSLSDMAMQQGEGQSGGQPQAISRSSSPGSRGHRNNRVRLPKADEYRPPKEFREDLLDALKEKYPKVYEDIIHKYYRRLVE